MISALTCYTSWYEKTLTFVVDMCGGLLYPTTYKGCTIKGGIGIRYKRPNEIWDKYSKARVEGASQALLNGLLTDYFEAKYQNNPMMLEIALRQMRVEPFVHLTVTEVSELPYIGPD
jgi:hypothetical protein